MAALDRRRESLLTPPWGYLPVSLFAARHGMKTGKVYAMIAAKRVEFLKHNGHTFVKADSAIRESKRRLKISGQAPNAKPVLIRPVQERPASLDINRDEFNKVFSRMTPLNYPVNKGTARL